MFLPKGRRYSWNLAAGDIPKDDVPSKADVTGISNEPYWERENEVFVTAKLRQAGNDHWRLSIESRIGDAKYQMHGAALNIPKEKLQWIERASSTDGRVAGSSGTKIAKPKEPIILLQRRTIERQPNGNYEPSPHPMPGFMVWLREE